MSLNKDEFEMLKQNIDLSLNSFYKNLSNPVGSPAGFFLSMPTANQINLRPNDMKFVVESPKSYIFVYQNFKSSLEYATSNSSRKITHHSLNYRGNLFWL